MGLCGGKKIPLEAAAESAIAGIAGRNGAGGAAGNGVSGALCLASPWGAGAAR